MKVAIVGCGQIAKIHAKSLSEKANLYFYSKTTNNAEKLNAKFSGGGVFNSYDDVLNSDVDAVVICTPAQLHAEQVITALKANKAILVEKPLCLSLNELIEIQKQLIHSKHSLLMVAENYYYRPSHIDIKHFIENGFIGDILSVHIKSTFKYCPDGWRAHCGSLIEGGVHLLSLLTDIIHGSPISIKSILSNFNNHIEKTSNIDFIFPNSIDAKFYYSWSNPAFSLPYGIFQHSEIIGTNGKITFENNGLYTIFNGKNHRIKPYIANPLTILGFKAMHDDFLSSVSNNNHPYSNFERANHVLRMIFDIYKCSDIADGI